MSHGSEDREIKSNNCIDIEKNDLFLYMVLIKFVIKKMAVEYDA